MQSFQKLGPLPMEASVPRADTATEATSLRLILPEMRSPCCASSTHGLSSSSVVSPACQHTSYYILYPFHIPRSGLRLCWEPHNLGVEPNSLARHDESTESSSCCTSSYLIGCRVPLLSHLS